MEKGHVSLRRGVSWSPGGVRKPLQSTQDLDAPGTECNASWEKRGYKGQPTSSPSTNQIGRKTNLTRSASLSEKELKEARVRSQIIAAQLTIPSNSNSRGVQLFNRRRQRVNAFTLESCGERKAGEVTAEHVKTSPPCNSLTWAEKNSEEKDKELNCKNSVAKSPWSPPVTAHRVGDIMEDPGEHIHEVEDIKDAVVQERHFLPVNEKEELEEEEEELAQEVNICKGVQKDEFHAELENKMEGERPCEGGDARAAPFEPVRGGGGENGAYTQPAPSEKLSNGCHSDNGPERVSVSISKQTPTFMNRTARPFFSPTTVQSPGAASPDMDLPAAPTYSTPRLPAFTRPVAFSPPPPPPSYPTPPLPAFSGQPPQSYSSPPPMSPVMSSPPVSQFPLTAPPVSQYIPPNPPVPHYGPPTAPRPSTFVPQSSGARKPVAPIKTGILEEGAARRANRKAMFTFKEKPVVAPNPELLSMVQGADEKRKHGNRSVPEPASEEELLALGAEASNFLAEEVRAEEEKAPEWATSLRSSMTRERADHKPEQSLTNASGKGAELFARRQSRMEKFVLENQHAGQMRSPSPTMSLPPSWVYPSNMPGRVKALAKNSDMCAQLSENMKAQQSTKRKPVKKSPPTAPVPEPPPLENGCTKIEMDLSRHQPYQLNSSLFILNPVKDPMSSLPRAAPPPKPVVTAQSYSRQTSLPSNVPSQFSPYASHAQCMSPQLPLSHAGGMDYPPNCGPVSASEQPRISSPVSTFSPERIASPRSGVQAPRPTFSAKKAGIAPQIQKESSTPSAPSQTSTPNRTPNFPRRFSSPDGPSFGAWSPSPQSNQPASNLSSSKPPGTSPVPPHWGSRCQSPAVGQTTQPPTVASISTSRPPRASTAASPVSPLWGSRCQSPMVCQPSQPSSTVKPLYTSTVASPVSIPREARCMSPVVNNLDSKANHRLLAKNIINAAKRKNSPSPGALSGHGLPISPLGGSHHGYDCNKPPFSPSPSRALSPPFTSPPPTPTQMISSPVRLYNTRSLTDSDASVESEDSGLRSPGLRSYNTCPRGWGGSLRVKRGSSVSTDL